MTITQSYLLRILADHLNRRPSSVDPDVDWDELIRLAGNHSLTTILYYQLNAAEPIRTRLGNAFAIGQFSYVNRVHVMGQIDNWFSEAGIDYFTVKGLDVAQLYPVPALRSMGDCDIIVHTKDRERAHELLVARGFEVHSKQLNEWVYFKDRMEYELHDCLLYGNEVVNTPEDMAFSDSVWDYVGGEAGHRELDWSYHFVFLLLHLKKHMLNRGVGFRQFMDLSVVVQNRALNWDWINETLEKLHLTEFAGVCFALCERWFEIRFPGNHTIAEDFYEPATERIFANGVFGFHDEENKKNGVLNNVKHGGKGRTVLLLLFPPFVNMSVSPFYTFVRGRRWLLPFAWVYRWFRLLFKGRISEGKEFIQNVAESEANIEKRDLALRQWGL